MCLYLSPPSGEISLGKLEEFSKKRLDFLLSASRCAGSVVALTDLTLQSTSIEGSECLIEGTIKDKIAHFILRLAFCQSPEMQKFFLLAEKMLFGFRLSCMDEQHKYQLFRSLGKATRDASAPEVSSTDFVHPCSMSPLEVVQFIQQQYRWKDLARYCDQGMADVFVAVPFTYTLDLVASRRVTVHKGLAYVPSCHLHEVITNLFEALLSQGMRLASTQLNSVMEDKRMADLFRTLKSLFMKQCQPFAMDIHVISNVKSEDIDELSTMFPLCMKHLHKQLRAKHRLSHFSRVEYTLYLKEVGLPVHEALRFWRDEYSQDPGCHGSGCCHTWQHDGRRYTYNIRHLYGLEGSRKNYRAHTCHAIINKTMGPMEEGGCPFMHFDRTKLQMLLEMEQLSQTVQQNLLMMSQQGHPQAACRMLLLEKIKQQGHGQKVTEIDFENFSDRGIGTKCNDCLQLNDSNTTNKSSVSSNCANTVEVLENVNKSCTDTGSRIPSFGGTNNCDCHVQDSSRTSHCNCQFQNSSRTNNFDTQIPCFCGTSSCTHSYQLANSDLSTCGCQVLEYKGKLIQKQHSTGHNLCLCNKYRKQDSIHIERDEQHNQTSSEIQSQIHINKPVDFFKNLHCT